MLVKVYIEFPVLLPNSSEFLQSELNHVNESFVDQNIYETLKRGDPDKTLTFLLYEIYNELVSPETRQYIMNTLGPLPPLSLSDKGEDSIVKRLSQLYEEPCDDANYSFQQIIGDNIQYDGVVSLGAYFFRLKVIPN